MSPADSQVEDIKNDLDRHRTRAQDKAQDTYQEGKEKSQNWWNKLFGMPLYCYLIIQKHFKLHGLELHPNLNRES